MKNLSFSKMLAAIMFIALMSAFVATGTGLPFLGVALVLAAISLLIPMPKGVAMMAITYPTDCDDLPGTHYCDECDDPELGRIRGIALIDKDFAFTDPTSYTQWFNGIAAGSIIIIPFTRGSFAGTPKEGTGYGDQATKYMGTDYELTFYDPNYATNRDFYNALKRYQKYKVAYKTETKVHITDKVCQVLPLAPVADDITSEVVWEVKCKWSSQNEPTPYTAPDGIFVCFEQS